MDGKRVVGRMADRDTTLFITQDTGGKMVDRGMDKRCQLIPVTVKTVDDRVVSVIDDHLHGGAGRRSRVDVTGCVVASGAVIAMGSQDIWPVLNRVTVRAGFVINHAEIGGRVNLHRMVNAAAG